MQIPAEQRVRRAQTFDEIAELYDAGRREPPGWIYETVQEFLRVEPAQTRVLEIGCGTGKSTLPLARRGYRVVALEMGANLAGLARGNLAGFPGVEVVNARFEDWEGTGSFDLAIAVTSWHWLDPERKYKRVAAALKGGGLLAIAESGPVFPEGYDPFFEQIQDAYEAIGVERLPWPAPPLESIGDSREEIERSGLFEDVRVMRRQWSEEFTADEYVAMMRTASDHRLMEVGKREWLYGEMRRLIEARPAGRVCKHNLTMLHLARRLG